MGIVKEIIGGIVGIKGVILKLITSSGLEGKFHRRSLTALKKLRPADGSKDFIQKCL